MTERDQRVFLNAMRELIAQQGAPATAIDAYLATVQFAETYTAFVTISHGPRGSIWVQRILSGDDLGGESEFNPQDLGSNTWDILDGDGRYLGDVTFPGKYQPIRSSMTGSMESPEMNSTFNR